MKYGLKLIRDTQTDKMAVRPILPLPDGAQGYRVRYDSRNHCAEALLVFRTRREAEAARARELEVLRYTGLPERERAAALADRLTRLAEYKLKLPAVAQLTGLSYETLYSASTDGRIKPSARQAARLIIAADLLLHFVETLPEKLPDPDLCGRPRPGHGVRLALYTDSPDWQQSRNPS